MTHTHTHTWTETFADKPDVVFLDTETTGLDYGRHEIWEIGYIKINLGKFLDWTGEPQLGSEKDGEPPYEIIQNLALPVFNFKGADPIALDVGRFMERGIIPGSEADSLARTSFLHNIGHIYQDLRNCVLVGAVPWFDARFLEKLFEQAGFPSPGLHYHYQDVEAMAIGHLSFGGILQSELVPPYSFKKILAMLKLDGYFDMTKQHNALYDSLLAMATWLKVLYNYQDLPAFEQTKRDVEDKLLGQQAKIEDLGTKRLYPSMNPFYTL